MADVIFVDPEATEAEVILVDGKCYRRLGESCRPSEVSDEDIEQEFEDCEECPEVECRFPCQGCCYSSNSTADVYEEHVEERHWNESGQELCDDPDPDIEQRVRWRNTEPMTVPEQIDGCAHWAGPGVKEEWNEGTQTWDQVDEGLIQLLLSQFTTGSNWGWRIRFGESLITFDIVRDWSQLQMDDCHSTDTNVTECNWEGPGSGSTKEAIHRDHHREQRVLP